MNFQGVLQHGYVLIVTFFCASFPITENIFWRRAITNFDLDDNFYFNVFTTDQALIPELERGCDGVREAEETVS